MGTRGWFQRSGSASLEFLFAEGDSVERSGGNFLQVRFVFIFQPFFSSIFNCHISFRPKFEPLLPLSLINFYINFI